MPQQMIDTPAFAYPNLQFMPYDLSRHFVPPKQVNLAPNSTFARGTVMGQVAGSASDVQTITIGGTPTGGTFQIVANGVTVTPAFNASTAAVQALLAPIYGAPNITVTGSAGTSYVLTFGGSLATMPIQLVTVSATGLTGGTPTAAVAHTTPGQTAGTYAAYASGHSDGTQTAKGILKNDVSTDGAGNVYFGPVAGLSRWGESYTTASLWTGGIFRTVLATGLDANAITNLGAHLESGTIADGVLVVP